MKTSAGIGLAAGLAAVLAGGGWLGAAHLGGSRLESALVAAARPTQDDVSSLRITKLDHRRGLLSSSGTLEIGLENDCEGTFGSEDALPLARIDYSVSHGPAPGSAARFEWSAVPAGDAAEDIRSLIGREARVTGRGTVGFSGEVRSEVAVPEVSRRRAGLRVSPSSGMIRFDSRTLSFDWKLDRFDARIDGDALTVRGTALALHWDDLKLRTGTYALAIERIGASGGTLEGLSLSGRTSAREQRLDMSSENALRRVTVDGESFRDIGFDLAVKGLDLPALEALSRIMVSSCGFEAMTAEEEEQVGQAVARLVLRGFEVGMPRIAAKADDGAFEGSLTIGLAPSKDGRASLARQLKASGAVALGWKGLPDAMRRELLAAGFERARGNGVKARFEFGDGRLLLNGRQYGDDDMVEAVHTVLEGLDEQMALTLEAARDEKGGLLAGLAESMTRGATAVTPAPAPAPAATPAAAPRASDAESCDTIDACVAGSLGAARERDIDAVRRLATRIDALPKPDQGNRPVGRQLNAAGLEAVKTDRFDDAAKSFEQGVRENPQDVEIVANLGFALARAGRPQQALRPLYAAVLLDPRRTATWVPLAEALAASGRHDDALAAAWLAFQWSGNRERTAGFFGSRADTETHVAIQQMYREIAPVAEQAIRSTR
jgi:tetratricopeptide (TPR) repeat protein